MAKKPKTEGSQPTTVQLGLHKQLGLEAPADEKPTLLLVPLGEIRNMPAKEDLRYEKEEWQGFLQSIVNQGIRVPIEVRADGVQGYIITDGRHRAEAARQLKLDSVPAVLRRDVTATSAAIGAFTLNYQRKESRPGQEARDFQAAIDGGMSVDDVATAAGISAATVRERLKLLKAPAKLVDRVGVDLRAHDIDFYGDLAKVPEVHAAALKVNIPKATNSWQVREVVVESLQKQGLLAGGPTSEDIKRIGGYENKTYAKRISKLKHIEVGRYTYCAEPAAAAEILADEIEKAKTKSATPKKKGETDEQAEARIERRATNRAKVAQRELAAKKLQAMVSWSDAQQMDATNRLIEYLSNNVHRKEDRAFVLAASGVDLDADDGLELIGDGVSAAFAKLWKQDRLQIHKLLGALMFVNDVGHEGLFGHDGYTEANAACKEWTGKTAKEIYGAEKAAVRVELKEAEEKRAARLAKNGGKPAAAKPGKPKKAKPATSVVEVDDDSEDPDVEDLEDGDEQ